MPLGRRILAQAEEWSGFEVRRQAAHHRVRLLKAQGVDLVVDVGAASGRYGLELRRAGYAGPIVSFEPLSHSFSALQATAAANRPWTAHRLALGSQSGVAEINVAGNSDSSSLLPMLQRHVEAAPHAGYVRTETIPVSTLDKMWPRMPTASRPFLKIDAQGFEGRVLEGAVETLPLIAGIQLELSFVPLYEGGLSYDDAIARMRDSGLIPMGVEPGFRDPVTAQLLQADVLFFRP